MTLYDLLRKLTTGERMYEDEQADALALIDRMESLNAFGSSGIYTAEHQCESDNKPVYVYASDNSWRGPNYNTGRKACHCKHCGREMNYESR